LISIIKEKILSEIFEFENDVELLTRFLKLKPCDSDFNNSISLYELENLTRHIDEVNGASQVLNSNDIQTAKNNFKERDTHEKIYTTRPFKRSRRNLFNDSNKNLCNSSNFSSQSRGLSPEREVTNYNYYPNELKEDMTANKKPHSHEVKFSKFKSPITDNNSVIVDYYDSNNSNFNRFRSVNKQKIPVISSYQMKLLFGEYIIDDDENSDFKETLNTGAYSENFYQNVYNKYNGLSKSLAIKRKNVCLKLLNILKLIVTIFVT